MINPRCRKNWAHLLDGTMFSNNEITIIVFEHIKTFKRFHYEACMVSKQVIGTCLNAFLSLCTGFTLVLQCVPLVSASSMGTDLELHRSDSIEGTDYIATQI